MNKILWSLIATLVIVQTIKVLVRLYHQKPITWQNYIRTGGMPSSHAAVVAALTLGVFLTEGIQSPLFAISIVFAFIVIRDTIGVRRTVGELTETVKRINKKRHIHEAPGHTPLEVAVGIIAGIIITSIAFVI